MKVLVATGIEPDLSGGTQRRLYYLIEKMRERFDVDIFLLRGRSPSQLQMGCESTPRARHSIFVADAGWFIRLITGRRLKSHSEVKAVPCEGRARGRWGQGGGANIFYKICFPFRINWNLLENFCKRLQKRDFDVLFCVKILPYFYWLMCEKYPLNRNYKVVIDEGALFFLYYYRLYLYHPDFYQRILNYLRFLRLYFFTRKFLKYCDFVTYVSEVEREWLCRLGYSGKGVYLPNYIDVDAIPFLPVSNCNILLLGPFDYYPNYHSLWWFFNRVFPLLHEMGYRGEIFVVGRCVPRWCYSFSDRFKGIKVLGWVSDLSSVYSCCGIFVLPVWCGGGQRTKLLEAMAYGKACIVSVEGKEGVPARDGVEFFVAHNEREFAERVMYLCKRKELIKIVGENARKFVDKHFSLRNLDLKFL